MILTRLGRYGDQRTPYSGIPTNHEPVIESTYNPALLSVTRPAFIPLAPALSCPPERPLDSIHSAYTSLLLTNRQINSELTSHFKGSLISSTSLFVSFPHGLHVLTTLTPHLTRQGRSVHLAGIHTSRHFDTARAVCLPQSANHLPPGFDQTYHGNTTPNTTKELCTLITSIFGPQPRYSSVQKLELRIYYPGTNSYTAVWGDDDSPVCIALRSIYAGEIGIEVWRGQRGTGVYLSATRAKEDEDGRHRKRVVSTVWRRLQEGRRGEPECGSWVVDPNWPEWEQEYDVDKGTTVVSSLVPESTEAGASR